MEKKSNKIKSLKMNRNRFFNFWPQDVAAYLNGRRCNFFLSNETKYSLVIAPGIADSKKSVNLSVSFVRASVFMRNFEVT